MSKHLLMHIISFILNMIETIYKYNIRLKIHNMKQLETENKKYG